MMEAPVMDHHCNRNNCNMLSRACLARWRKAQDPSSFSHQTDHATSSIAYCKDCAQGAELNGKATNTQQSEADAIGRRRKSIPEVKSHPASKGRPRVAVKKKKRYIRRTEGPLRPDKEVPFCLVCGATEPVVEGRPLISFYPYRSRWSRCKKCWGEYSNKIYHDKAIKRGKSFLRRWHRVEDCLPEDNQIVDVWIVNERICDIQYQSKWGFQLDYLANVTHWIELPPKPGDIK